MRLGKREAAILQGLASDVAEYAAEVVPVGRQHSEQRHRRRLAQDDMAKLDPAKWLGIPSTNSQSVMNSRSYHRLEDAGLVERVLGDYSDKTAYLRITEAGKVEADELRADWPIAAAPNS